MKNGFIKVATASPSIRIADVESNAEELIRLTLAAEERRVHLLVFPSLSLCGATAQDLFLQNKLLVGVRSALRRFLAATAHTTLLSVLGLPWCVGDRVYSCAAFCQSGKLLGLVPKTHLAASGATADARIFSAAPDATQPTALFDDEEIPFGTDLRFDCMEVDALRISAELGEDADAPIPPAAHHALAGATVICALACEALTVRSTEARMNAIAAASSRLSVAYLHAGGTRGESTTDAVLGGLQCVYECGTRLAFSEAQSDADALMITEIDVERITFARRHTPYRATEKSPYRRLSFSLPVSETALSRFVDPHPFLPEDPMARDAACERILSIQSKGLAQRIERAYAKTVVLGISGGLDSTLALLVAARAMDSLRRPRTDIIALTMPCFGTTARTKNNATLLCERLGVDFRTVDIFDAVNLHFRDIGHNPALRDVTYENAQARERTQILMDVANRTGGLVIGTGDLSELALGWATYNGDHMSMYGVNASVPKTVIRHLVAYCAKIAAAQNSHTLAAALLDVLDTPVSPELLPANESDGIEQKTEDLVGPYELHDFYLYYMLRHGFSPEKLYRLSRYALGDAYDDETLKKWLKTFLRRFFAQQFKRSCLPDGPAVDEISLSPRTSWHMPSDAVATLWLTEAELL